MYYITVSSMSDQFQKILPRDAEPQYLGPLFLQRSGLRYQCPDIDFSDGITQLIQEAPYPSLLTSTRSSYQLPLPASPSPTALF